jgi:two-component system response regulator QseB
LRILVVEDDTRIAEPVVAALRSQQHCVDVASNGKEGLDLCRDDAHDVVLLDVMLPGLSGIEICRALRRRGSSALVLMMTARDSVRDKVAALDEGADDYLVKPFDLEELLARVRALSRRTADSRGAVLRHGKLELDPTSARVRYGERLVDLTRTEHGILEALLRQPTRVFSSDVLYERVGNVEGSGTAAAIKSHVANLRKKLRAAESRRDVILTVHGFGYRLGDA